MDKHICDFNELSGAAKWARRWRCEEKSIRARPERVFIHYTYFLYILLFHCRQHSYETSFWNPYGNRPFWANIFLYAYEPSYMTDLISLDKVKARHFHSTKRFIDDLCALNDGGEVGKVHKDISTNELEHKVEHCSHASFLNLDYLYINCSINVMPFFSLSYVCLSSPAIFRRAFLILLWLASFFV